MKTKRQVGISTEDYLVQQPVFTLDEFAEALGGGNGSRTAMERVRNHLGRGRLKRMAKGLYAAVPRGVDPQGFVPDRYLVAAAARTDAVQALLSSGTSGSSTNTVRPCQWANA